MLVVAAVIIGLLFARRFNAHSSPPIARAPATAPATLPTTAPATKPAPPPQDLLGLVRADDPKYPTTRELDIPGNYDQAAHLVLDQPVYLCPLGHLWITDARGKPTTTVLANLESGNSHIVPDKIVFVHWQLANTGKWIASAVRENSAGGFDLVQTNRTTPLRQGRHWLWDRRRRGMTGSSCRPIAAFRFSV